MLSLRKCGGSGGLEAGRWDVAGESLYFLHSWASWARCLHSLSLSLLIDCWKSEGREERMTGLQVALRSTRTPPTGSTIILHVTHSSQGHGCLPPCQLLLKYLLA